MNVYEQTNLLVQAIKESQEWKDYNELKTEASKDEMISAMISEFQQDQIKLQTKGMLGQKTTPEEYQKLQEKYTYMINEPLVAKYMQAEMRYTIMMNDVYRLIGETMGLEVYRNILDSYK